jgi:hypothetical protein
MFRETDVTHLVPDHDETAGVDKGQRTNQNRIDGTEHRGVYSDAERQRCDGDGRERWIAADLAQSVTDITGKLLQARPAPRRANILAHNQCVAERPMNARSSGLLSLEIQVIPVLAFEVALPTMVQSLWCVSKYSCQAFDSPLLLLRGRYSTVHGRLSTIESVSMRLRQKQVSREGAKSQRKACLVCSCFAESSISVAAGQSAPSGLRFPALRGPAGPAPRETARAERRTNGI